MTGIRGGGIISGAGSPGAVPQKIITDEVNKRKSLKGECGDKSFTLNRINCFPCRDRELNCEPGEIKRRRKRRQMQI